MKAVPLSIHWHQDNQPVYSAHFEPNGKRLATAGGDNNVRLWHLSGGEDKKVTYLSTLAKHTQAVNVVRWCPRGEMLASAGDDGNVILWVQSNSHTTKASYGEDESEDKETWRQKHMCRSMGSEIYDLAWSPDGDFFITGSMDNVARIYDAQKGTMIRQIAEHNAYVQGVAWDPLNEYVATQSSDRSVHIYALKSKDGQFSLSQHNKISRMDLPASRRNHSASPAPPDMTTSAARAHVPDASALLASPIPSAPGTPTSFGLPMNPPTVVAHSRASSFSSSPSLRRSPSPSPALPLPAVKPVDSPKLLSVGVKNHLMYHDDAMTSFFRRLAFTPDGSLLFTPAGQYKIAHATPADGVKTADEIINTVYVYTRAGLNKPPVAHLPGHKKPSVAVSCSPILYTFRKSAAQTKHITVDTSSADDSISLLPPPAINTEMDPPPTTNLHTPPATGAPTNATFALPYRIVYAVATKDSVLIYDTQQQTPLCVVSNLHYAAFTDLTWSPDGNTLLMTSTDGFCSVVTFLPGELGNIYSSPTSVAGSATSNPMAAAATGVVPSAAAAAGISPPVEPPLKRPPSPFLVSGSSAPRIPINPVRGVNTPTSFPSAASASAGTPESTGELAPIVSTLPGVSSNVSGFSLGAQGPWKTPPATPASTSGVAAPATVSGSGVSSSGGPSPPASGGTVLGKREVEEEKAEVAEGVKEGSEVAKGGDKKRRRIVPTLIRGLGEE